MKRISRGYHSEACLFVPRAMWGRGAPVAVSGSAMYVSTLDTGHSVVASGLDMPTSVVEARGTSWVTQGQLGRLLANPPVPPILPFLVKRVDVR